MYPFSLIQILSWYKWLSIFQDWSDQLIYQCLFCYKQLQNQHLWLESFGTGPELWHHKVIQYFVCDLCIGWRFLWLVRLYIVRLEFILMKLAQCLLQYRTQVSIWLVQKGTILACLIAWIWKHKMLLQSTGYLVPTGMSLMSSPSLAGQLQ